MEDKEPGFIYYLKPFPALQQRPGLISSSLKTLV